MRHVSVESPDGSVCIAFTEEVAPPPDPPEVILVHMSRTVGVRFSPVAKTLAYVLFLTSMFTMVWFHRLIDGINLVMISLTNVAMYPKRSPFVLIQLVLHGSVSGLMVIPFCVMLMWGQALYQTACCVTCVFSVFSAEDITEEFVVQHLGEIPQEHPVL